MEKWDGKFLKKVGQLCDDRPDSHFVSVRTGEKNTYMILGSDNDVLIVFVCLPVCLSVCLSLFCRLCTFESNSFYLSFYQYQHQQHHQQKQNSLVRKRRNIALWPNILSHIVLQTGLH